MKKLYLFIALTIPLTIFSQSLIEKNFPTKDGKIHYADVVNVDSSLTSTDLYLNAKEWLVGGFKSSKAVIQTDDKEAKLIIIKSYVEKGHNKYVINPKNWFILKIEMKEGRYRYALYDINYEFGINAMGQSQHFDAKPFEVWIQPSKQLSVKKQQKFEDAMTGYCKELDAEFKSIISSLEKGLNKVEKDEW